MSEEAEEVRCPPEGLPQYMGTFADLMALLMCFFVLLLAFSEMDVLKYKQVAGSMRDAFGVQNKIEAKSIPKGTSVIAQEFSPGKPQPTLITQINQQTTDTDRETLEFTDAQGNDAGESEGSSLDDQRQKEEVVDRNQSYADNASENKEPTKEIEALALKVMEEMSEEITSGQIEIEAAGRLLKIRINEKGSFAPGEARIQNSFRPIISKIREILKSTDGQVMIDGHTDNIPIKTSRFPSNWELSAARAATVARILLDTEELDRKRFSISGFAELYPVPGNDNSTRENRAKNRRVEIVIRQGSEKVGEDITIN